MKLIRTLAVSLVCMLLGIFIAWQYQSIRNNASIASLENKRRSELQEELFSEKKKIDALEAQLLELQQLNKALELDIGGNDENFKRLIEEKDKYKMIAGLTTVKGDGVIITLKDTEYTYIRDVDILPVINELKAADVQAIAMNDERLVATTEIRSAGRYIMVNGRQLLSPYVIKAIADPDKLEHSLKIMGGVVEKLQEYDISVDVKKEAGIIIPKVRDDGTVLRFDKLKSIE